MANPNRIGGVLSLTIDGKVYEARGNFTVSPSKVKRTGVAGQDGVHGYIEENVVPGIKGDVSIGNKLSLTQLEAITDSTAQVDLANGVSYVLSNAWTEAAFAIDTHDGKFELNLQGFACTEMPS